MSRTRILVGDVRERLAEIDDGSVQTCVTSPPYWGLRDYGTASWDGGDPECDHAELRGGVGAASSKQITSAGASTTYQARDVCRKCGARRIDQQIGLEQTPEAYVAEMVGVFREVRRCLRDDGTLWLNIGDSYCGGGGFAPDAPCNQRRANGESWGKMNPHSRREGEARTKPRPGYTPPGLKPKDLVGIPWSLAKALQAPYYAGDIPRERDRVWLAAIIDGEGTICGFRHERKDDGRVRTGAMVSITNSCEAMLAEANRIWPASKYAHMASGEGHLGSRAVFRWKPTGSERKSALLRELYPYLITKRRQALVAWNMLEFVKDGRRLGKSQAAQDVRDKRDAMTVMLSRLNAGESVDLPGWLREPPSLHEPGWFLRSDIIWAKPNPMPESVRDRPTKAHEYVFLLSKSGRYFYDAEAIAEESSGRESWFGDCGYSAASGRNDGGSTEPKPGTGTRNARTVWTIATQPFPGSHFAVMPPELAEKCIRAGSAEGDTVLDPFGGAGTTALVANRLGRDAVLIELNPEYAEMARKRVHDDAPMFNVVEVVDGR